MKLIYFNARGRAELSRLILAQAGEDYEDKRVEREEWPALKPCKYMLRSKLHIIVKLKYPCKTAFYI